MQMQNRVGIPVAFIYAASYPVGGHNMLRGSEQPTENGRGHANGTARGSVSTSGLKVDRRVATKLWHTHCDRWIAAVNRNGSRAGARRIETGEHGISVAVVTPHICVANLFLGHRC